RRVDGRRGGEYPQVLTQVEDVVLGGIDVREIGVGPAHQLDLRGRRRATQRIAAHAGRSVELLEDWRLAGIREGCERSRLEGDVVRETDPLRDRGDRRILELRAGGVGGNGDLGEPGEGSRERGR